MTDEVQRLADAIAASHGLVPRGDWHTAIDRVLRDMAVSASALRGPLAPTLVERVAGALTVPETFFMRHRGQLEQVTEHLVMRLRRGAASLEVLSAGCSTGEEPYSLVLCLLRSLGDYRAEQIRVRACDISPDAIARAGTATYGKWSFRDVPDWLLARHFETTPEGRHRLTEDVRQRVVFRQCSISSQVADLGDGSMDAVLFRNVGIYLSVEHLAEIYSQFRRILRPDGLLVVAPSDPRPPRGLFQRTDHESTGIYGPRAEGDSPSAWPRRERRRPQPPVACETVAAPGVVVAPAQPAPPTPEAIRALADAGDLAQAIEQAAALVTASPLDAEAHLLLGQMHLAGSRVEDGHAAIEHMRRAVFLAPEHALARFWYAQALLAGGRLKKALVQLEALGLILRELPADRRFDEAGISVAELSAARSFLLEGVQ